MVATMTTAIDWVEISKTGKLPEGLNLFTEENTFKILNKRIVEDDSDGKALIKRMRLTGIIQRANIFNENHRRYSTAILEEAVRTIQPQLQARKVMGELDHAVDAKIHLDRVSHLMTKVWMENEIVYGELEILEDMPCGKMLKVLIEADVTIGISSRGIGDMKPVIREDTGEEGFDVLPGYRIVTWDTVAEPSVGGAQLSVMESKQIALGKKKNSIRRKEGDLLIAIRDFLSSK